MECPRCNQTMSARATGAMEIPTCERCGGMFFDQGELNKATERTDGDLEYSTVDLDSKRHDDEFGTTICPRCLDVAMDKVEFNIHTGIILDYCRQCRGFWLDGRELQRIDDEVRKLNEAAREVSSPPMLWFASFIWSLPR